MSSSCTRYGRNGSDTETSSSPAKVGRWLRWRPGTRHRERRGRRTAPRRSALDAGGRSSAAPRHQGPRMGERRRSERRPWESRPWESRSAERRRTGRPTTRRRAGLPSAAPFIGGAGGGTGAARAASGGGAVDGRRLGGRRRGALLRDLDDRERRAYGAGRQGPGIDQTLLAPLLHGRLVGGTPRHAARTERGGLAVGRVVRGEHRRCRLGRGLDARGSRPATSRARRARWGRRAGVRRGCRGGPPATPPRGSRARARGRGRRRVAWRGGGWLARSCRAAYRCPGRRSRGRSRARCWRPRRRPRHPVARTTSRSPTARRGGGRGRRRRVPAPRASSSTPTRSTRGKSAISADAERTTSSKPIGSCHWRGGSAPDSTRRLSALRRMRVAMWSSLKSVSSAAGSCSLRSSSSSSSSCRSSRLWLRRARLTNRSPMPLRSSRAWSRATWTVTASMSLNACASSPISSAELISIGGMTNVSTSPPARIDSTSWGSCFCDISRGSR